MSSAQRTGTAPSLAAAVLDGMLILAAGLYVIFFAGLSWRLVIPALLLGAAFVSQREAFRAAAMGRLADAADWLARRKGGWL